MMQQTGAESLRYTNNLHNSTAKKPTVEKWAKEEQFTIAKTWNQPKCPLTDDWVRKMWYIYTNGILLSHKKEQNNAIFSNMDGTRDSNSE